MSFLNWRNFNRNYIGKQIKTDRHNGAISRWFRRYHRILEVLVPFLAVGVSAYSAWQTNKALNLNIQEFNLRNRPYVILKDGPKFGEDIKYPIDVQEGIEVVPKGPHEYKKSVDVYFQNISEIPAQKVWGNIVLYLNGAKCNTLGIHPPICLVKDSPQLASIGLEQDQYNAVIAGSTKLSVIYTIKYSDTFKKNFETSVTVEFEVYKDKLKAHFLEYTIK